MRRTCFLAYALVPLDDIRVAVPECHLLLS
jgi:hypothetical protein